MKVAFIFDKHREGTTGTYLERACGALGVAADHWWLREAKQIPAGYDLYLRIDHGDDYLVRLPARLRPAVFYAIDTHLAHSWKKVKRTAGWYDMVFCCHRDGAARLRGAVWLPVACDPQVHASRREERPAWDVAFVGTDGGVPRKFYLQALRERYAHSAIGPADYTQMREIYGRTRIGFNYAIAQDVNMRVFETLAAGACLVTNALAGDDLERLGLRDREHLVLYRRPAELFPAIDHYLAHDEERQRIGRAGQALVLARHTYVHRMRQLLTDAVARLSLPPPLDLKESAACASW